MKSGREYIMHTYTIYDVDRRGKSITELTPEGVRKTIEKYKPRRAEELILHMYRLFREAEKAGMKEVNSRP